MTDKRELENAQEGPPAAKKPRSDAPAKPGLSLEALEKAKRALQMQKELKEKLKNLPQLQKPAGTSGAAPAASGASEAQSLVAAAQAKAAQIAARFGVAITPAPGAVPAAPTAPSVSVGVGAAGAAFKPAPLRLDAQGREIDEFGNPVEKAAPAAPVATLRVNQLGAKPASEAPTEAVPGAEPDGDAFFDPGIGARGLKKLNRRTRATFDFVHEGEFQRQAELFRLRAKYGKDAGARSLRAPTLGAPSANANLLPLGPVNPNAQLGSREGTPGVGAEALEEPLPEVPDVEWWDKGLLANGTYADVAPAAEGGGVAIKDSKITLYIEHPVPIEPPAEAPAPPPQPLKLTAKELKKLRTQRRQAREKEKQELIRQGLLEPPKPKVRLANLYRVLGEQAVADPTMMEMETRKQMAERQAAHDDRNLSRQLTPAERRDKKLRKLFDDTGVDVTATVYRLSRLDNPSNRFKVDVNAKENHMTGVGLVAPSFSLIVVEGCPKSTKRYAKLMLRRMDWSLPPGKARGRRPPGTAPEEEEEEEQEDVEPATCDLVWQGVVKKRAFERFAVEDCSNDEHALAVLTARGVPHYWHTAANWIPGEAPPVELV